MRDRGHRRDGPRGGATARLLTERGAPLRLVVRDPARAPDPGAEVRAAPSCGARDDVAAVCAELSRLTGRRIAYKDETPAEAWASRATYGAPDGQVEAWISTYTSVAAGVERFTRRAPRTLADVIR